MSTQTKRILDSSWLWHVVYKEYIFKKNTILLLYSLFTIPKKYLLPAKRKVADMSWKIRMSVLYWIFSNHLHSYCIHCKRRGMQQCRVFLNCWYVEKMTLIWTLWPTCDIIIETAVELRKRNIFQIRLQLQGGNNLQLKTSSITIFINDVFNFKCFRLLFDEFIFQSVLGPYTHFEIQFALLIN